jgi:hypothetical protein
MILYYITQLKEHRRTNTCSSTETIKLIETTTGTPTKTGSETRVFG